MQSQKFKFGLTILDLFLIILALFLLIFLLYRLIKSGKLMRQVEQSLEAEPEQDPEQDPEQNEFNPIPAFYKKVVETLPDLSPEMQAYITAQAMHETGIFTSPLFLEHNNAFGMKMPTQRRTTASKQTESGYAHYESIEDSIKDLSLYFDAKNYPETFPTVQEYIEYAKNKGYFEAPLKSYTNAVVKHLNAVKPFAQ